jgi:hypothetical protein
MLSDERQKREKAENRCIDLIRQKDTALMERDAALKARGSAMMERTRRSEQRRHDCTTCIEQWSGGLSDGYETS